MVWINIKHVLQKINNENYRYFSFINKKKIFLFGLLFFIMKIDLLKNYLSLKKDNKIKIGIISNSLKNGGVERQTAILLNYLSKKEFFQLYSFTREGPSNLDYIINNNIKRVVFGLELKKKIEELKPEIIIYQEYILREMYELNELKNIKIIFINHSCFFYWIYMKYYNHIVELYNIYKKNKYIISLIPYESDYLFKKWGINSILMNNFVPYDYNSAIPSDLSSKRIAMIGRGNDKQKRFYLGIESMQYIVKEIPTSEMIVISESAPYLQVLTEKLHLNKNIIFLGYHLNPEIFFKNVSLHIFPSVAESFGNVLCETLLYGIPNILVGIDYVSMAKGGTLIIYDDSPVSIAKIVTKILLDNKLRRKLGKNARKNVKKLKNDLLVNKWISLILSIYKNDNYSEYVRNQSKKIDKNEAIRIIEKQIYLLNRREKQFQNITIENFENFTYIENLLRNIS